MRVIHIRLITGIILIALLAVAQKKPPLVGEGWLPEFEHATNQINALAEATPADKFSWRPAPGIRSVSEVYMHVAIANYYLAMQTGVAIPESVHITADTEKQVTAKADVIAWLKGSQKLVRENYPKATLSKKTKLFGEDVTVDGVWLRVLVHNHEHMGQSIAYARTIGVKPPWSE